MSMRKSGFAMEFMGVFGFVLFALFSWILSSLGLKDLAITAGVFALVSVAFGLALGPIKRELVKIKREVIKLMEVMSAFDPKTIDAYHASLDENGCADHCLPLIARNLFSSLEPAFLALGKAEKLEDNVFFKKLRDAVDKMGKGDQLMAICGRKFWSEESKKLVDEYWKLNKKKTAEGVLVMRVFVSDHSRIEDPDFSPEVSEAMEQHKIFLAENKNQHLKIKKVDKATRNALKKETWCDPKFGFVLLSRGKEKIVALHRLDGSHLKGSIINDPLVYSVFEQHFWSVWEVGTELDIDYIKSSEEVDNTASQQFAFN